MVAKVKAVPYRKIAKGIVVSLGDVLHWFIFKVLMPKKYRHVSKQEINRIIFKSDTPAGRKFDLWLLVLICLNVVLLLVDSSPSVTGWLSFTFKTVEWLLTIAFTLEYYLRIYCSRRPWRYVLSFYGIIDFLSIFPAYLSLLIPATQTMTVLRILRTLRIFRILRLQRFIVEGQRLLNSLRRSMYKIVIFMLFVFIVAVILGAVMYMFENGKNEAFNTIPNGIYWAVVTITTVGYGDITPVTHAGRFISIVVMLLGYSIIAVPTGIVVGETLKEGRRGATPATSPEAESESETEAEAASIPDIGDPESVPVVKHCPYCGYEETDPQASYCSRCGAKLTTSPNSWLKDFFFS